MLTRARLAEIGQVLVRQDSRDSYRHEMQASSSIHVPPTTVNSSARLSESNCRSVSIITASLLASSRLPFRDDSPHANHAEVFYHYRQYDAIEFSRQRTFEEVWYLLRDGDLPSPRQLAAFTTRVAKARALPATVAYALPAVVALIAEDQPLPALRTAFELMALDQQLLPWIDIDVAALDDQAIMTAAVFPSLVVALYGLKRGQHLVEPRQDLGHAAFYMYMLTGQAPAPARARALESYLTSTIDHGFNASTFTARVVASTGADLGSAVIAALGSLSGPLDGGAPCRVLDMLGAIGAPDRADRRVRDTLTSGGKLMGFGHPVYHTTDPRNTMVRAIAEELGSPMLDLAVQVEQQALCALRELRPGAPIYANVEYYAAIVLDAVGVPRELFTPTFAIGRVIGWTAHITEQAGHNPDNAAQRPLRGPRPGRQMTLFRQDSSPGGLERGSFEVRGVVIGMFGVASVSCLSAGRARCVGVCLS
jgi:citrate synthase